MPTFATPKPISLAVAIGVGDVRIVAGDRQETVVVVSPSDSSKGSDQKAAEQTQVEYSEGRLLVRAPRSWKRYTPFGGAESIDVSIELPAGSDVECEASVADLRCQGRLGECRLSTGVGSVRLQEAGRLQLSTGAGSVTVERVGGPAEVTGSGPLRIGEVQGPAVVKNLNGATWMGEVGGELRCNAANGDISVERALGGVSARTATGAIRIGEVVRGSIDLRTAYGELEVGVRAGTAALLDVRSQFGSVRTSLSASDGPEPSDQTVEVRARTSCGDVVIRRSTSPQPGSGTT